MTDPVFTHRLEYWEWVKRHAVPAMRDVLLRLRDHWHHLNGAYYGSAMTEPYITLTEPSAPRIYGQCCPVSSWGSRLEIRIRPSLLTGTHPHMCDPAEGRFLFVADVLAHESIHQWQQEHTGRTEESYHGHGPCFTEMANAIGAAMGLPSVIVKNRAGTRMPRSAQWPHCVRDAEYYMGAYRPPTNRDTVPCPHCEGTGRLSIAEITRSSQ